jgi:protocatechuate 3,4-dioxygenase beta subunit
MTPIRALVVAVFVATGVFAQPERPTSPPEPALYFQGRVHAATTNDPLTRARVAVAAEGLEEEAVLTNNGGRFSIGLARPVALTLKISKAGYASQTVRVSRDEVSSGELHEVRLEIGAAISGRVVDNSGRPVVGIPVVMRHSDSPGKAPAQGYWASETDDRGEYRVGGLPAGEYAVAISESRGKAEKTRLKPGDDVSGVNFVLNAPASTTRTRSSVNDIADDTHGSATLLGRVLGELGEPLVGARLRLLRHGTVLRSVTTDANGNYAFSGIPAGRFTIGAANPGYVTLEYGQRTSTESGTTLHVRENQTLRGLEFMLPRGSAITGSVVDEHGEPVEGAVVRALQLRFMTDRMMALNVPGVRERRSDDRGHYRLFGLLPGKYLISASIEDAVSNAQRQKGHGYAPSFYPGTSEIAGAWRVEVDTGRDVFGAHLVLAPSVAARISGKVFDSRGIGLRGLVVLTPTRWSRAATVQPRTAPVNGTFVLTNVPPGEYVLQAIESSDVDRVPEFGFQYVRVIEGDLSLFLTTSPGATLRGRVSIEGDVRAEGDRFQIKAAPADLDRAPVRVSTTTTYVGGGDFEVSGLHGATRFVLTGAPSNWYLKSVVINGRDATDHPYEFGYFSRHDADGRFVLSPNAAVMQGKVIDDSAAPVSDYTVLVFARDRRKWFAHSRYLKFTRPSQDDSFEVSGLPPGEYCVIATRSLDATDNGGEWQNPEVLEKLAIGAERVTVGEGDWVSLTLRLR